jgi:hypothetical protein
MSSDRRTFLRLAASAGLSLSLPFAPRAALAEGERYSGPFWVTIHASGGWDPTLLCDPKGRATADAVDPVNTFLTDDIEEVGPFRVAPIAGHRDFFEKYRSELLVLNGVDTGTNSHDTGTRHVWSGGLDANMPALSALIAAANEDQLPLPYLTNGGYEVTADLVSATRLPGVSAVNEIAYPHRLDPATAGSEIFTSTTIDRIAQARAARLERLTGTESLPRVRGAMGILYQARQGVNDLAELATHLPATLDNSANPLLRQAEVAAASFRAGITVSASLTIGGFDTHGNHDQGHTPRMQMVLAGIDHLLEECDRHGIRDQVIVVVGSDFARTPWYNDTNGKDHWSITSMMLLGPGISGGRVIGGTDGGQLPFMLDSNTLATADTGIRLTPGHVHASLRTLAGIDDNPIALPWQVGDYLPLLG